jgi:hypothetical protein
MEKHSKITFRKIDHLSTRKSVGVYDRALERALITTIVMLVAAILTVTESRLPPELRVGFFEATYASP